MAQHTAPQPHLDIIDLTSDEESDRPPTRDSVTQHNFRPNTHYSQRIFNQYMNDMQANGQLDQQIPNEQQPAVGGVFVQVDGEAVFIPDEVDAAYHDGVRAPTVDPHTVQDVEQDASAGAPETPEDAAALENMEVTAEVCLQRVLSIFPDISHDHVLRLYNDFNAEGHYEILPGQARLDNIMEQLISNMNYPKQEKGKKPLKRKREDSIDEGESKKWEQPDRVVVPSHLKGPMQAMLKAEFGEIPNEYISNTLAKERYLFQAYISLAKDKDSATGTDRPYGKGRPTRQHHLANADTIAANCGWPELLAELNAARLRMQTIRMEKAAEDAKKRAEQENLDRAIAAGETAECTACFDDLPMNRQIHCNGSIAHFICFECVLNYIKSEIGQSRSRVLCTAGCGSGFAANQLNLLDDKPLLEKLAQLQQEQDIRDAGLDDLEECPFCDYKAILPPIDEDFEFRCANPDCEKVSCRRCKSLSHIPVSCEEHAKDNKINSRHKIEEAMTAALIRTCNKCQKNFIKDYGCNKMSCQSCGNLQCYVCSENVKDYNHFDQRHPGSAATGSSSKARCPLYDNVEERHEREVKEAEAKARQQVVEENPDVTAEDLEIKVSDRVKKSAADRIRQAAGGYGPLGAAADYLGGFMGGGHIFGGRAHVPGGEAAAGIEGGLGDHWDLLHDIVGGQIGEPRDVHREARHQRIRDRVQQRAQQRAQRVAAFAQQQQHMQQMQNHRLQQAALQQRQQAHQHTAAAVQHLVGPNHVQGYIPVLGFNPAPVPQLPHQGAPAHNHHHANAPGYDDWLHGLFHPFGAAAHPHAAPNNNNNPHQHGKHAQHAVHHPHVAMPGAFPVDGPFVHHAPVPPRIVARDQTQNFRNLERLRQRHEEHLLRDQQETADLERLQQEVRRAHGPRQ